MLDMILYAILAAVNVPGASHTTANKWLRIAASAMVGLNVALFLAATIDYAKAP